MNSEEILELIGNISPHAVDYVKSAIENNCVEKFYSISGEVNKGVFLAVNDDDCCIFYASFINESGIEQVLEGIRNKINEYIPKMGSKEICFNVYGENTRIINFVRELGFKIDMEGYHLEYAGEKLLELKHCDLTNKGFESSMIKKFIDLFDSAYYQLNIDNGWSINGYAVNEEGFLRKLKRLNELGQVRSFWLNDELAGAYIIEQNYISDIVVNLKFQNRGYGSCILAHCIRNMRENKSVKNIRLRVAKSNTGAKRFYERNNFVEIACFAEHTYTS